MRFFWKIVVGIFLSLGAYQLCKKSVRSSEDDAYRDSPQDKEVSTEQALEQLSNIDGVTSRVAENLIKRGIYTKDELFKLSREALMEVKGIGPKRADKILHEGRSESTNN